MSRRLLIPVLVAALTAAAVAAGTASAAGRIRLTEAQATFPERAYVLSLPARMQLRAGQVQVLENGQSVPGLEVAAADTAATRQFGIVLVIDASDSMHGAPIAGALRAARAFSDQRSAQEQIAIVTFNSGIHVVQPFTTDGARIHKSLSHRPRLHYGTHIYDGVDAAVTLLRDSGIKAGSIIVLSDGADAGSRLGEAAVAKHARSARVRVFTVGLRSRYFKPKALRNLAADTGAQYSEATSPAELRTIYRALGTKLAREYLIRYTSAAGPDKRIVVSVRVRGLPGLVTSGYVTPRLAVKSPAKAKAYHESFLHKLFTSPVMMVFIALLAAALVSIAIVALASSVKRGTLRKRMAEFVSLPAPSDKERPSEVLTDRVEDGTERVLGRTRWWGRFVDEVEFADIKATPERIVLFTFIGAFLTVWMLSVIIHSLLVALLIGLAIPFLVRTWVRRKVEKKRRLFAEQLPDNLQVLASALRAGHSFIGALSVVVDDAPEPSRSEFRRVIADEQLGVPLEDALHTVVERMENRELEQVALVAALQRQTGGNTAEVLDRVTDTIRERFELRRTVQTLTAQGRLSRWVVSFLPLFLLLAISVINPGYMHVLYASTTGRIALVFAALMVVAGSVVIKRIINIKV